MTFLMFVVVLIVGVQYAASAHIQARIFGGDAIGIAEAPYQAAVQYFQKQVCGGAIISSKLIVTAAHCIHGRSAQNVSVRVKSSVFDFGQELPVAKIVEHKLYNSETRENDIANLILGTPIAIDEFNSYPVRLPPRNSDWSDVYGYVTGWGRNDQDATNLLGIYLPIIPRDDCRKYFSDFVNGMICAGYLRDGTKNVCDGDDGGPLVVGDTLAGIVSWGFHCGRIHPPTVFTDVSAYIDFINDYIDG